MDAAEFQTNLVFYPCVHPCSTDGEYLTEYNFDFYVEAFSVHAQFRLLPAFLRSLTSRSGSLFSCNL